MTKTLFEFDTDLWNKFKDKLTPYKSQNYVIEQLVKIFIGLEADEKIVNEVKRMVCK